MALVKTKPTSAGRRSMVKVVNADLHKGAPYAPLVEALHKRAGRNHMGNIMASSRRAIALDGRHQLPRAEYILGRALAHRNDEAGAVEHMRRYLELLPQAPDAAVVRAQITAATKPQAR